MQVLKNILTVVDQLLGNSTRELLGLSQIRHASSSRYLAALDNFVRKVDSENQKNKTFNLINLTTELPNVAFSINRDLFTYDVFLIVIHKEGNVSVRIRTGSKLAEITSKTLAVITIPKETFIENPETLYSFCFTKSTLFLSEEQLENINGSKTIIDQVVDSVVFSASILGRRVENLSNPIVLVFKKSDQQKEDEKFDCQFWSQSRGKFP